MYAALRVASHLDCRFVLLFQQYYGLDGFFTQLCIWDNCELIAFFIQKVKGQARSTAEYVNIYDF